jgi:hypothetical protein
MSLTDVSRNQYGSSVTTFIKSHAFVFDRPHGEAPIPHGRARSAPYVTTALVLVGLTRDAHYRRK